MFVLIFHKTLIIHRKVKGKGMMNFKCRQEDPFSHNQACTLTIKGDIANKLPQWSGKTHTYTPAKKIPLAKCGEVNVCVLELRGRVGWQGMGVGGVGAGYPDNTNKVYSKG